MYCEKGKGLRSYVKHLSYGMLTVKCWCLEDYDQFVHREIRVIFTNWFLPSDIHRCLWNHTKPTSNQFLVLIIGNYLIYPCISRPLMTEKSAQKITLDFYTGHRQRPDPSNSRNYYNNCLKSVSKTKFTKPVLIVFKFHQFSVWSSLTKKFEIINFMWLKQKSTGADFYCIFWYVEQTFSHTVSLLFSITIAWSL